MRIETARNIAIVVALALVVWLVPGGGEGAGFVSQLLSAAFIAIVVVILARAYQRYRSEIYGLGEQWRLALYAAVGVAVVTVAGTRRLTATGPGTLLWVALLGGASFALYRVWRQYRSYA